MLHGTASPGPKICEHKKLRQIKDAEKWDESSHLPLCVALLLKKPSLSFYNTTGFRY